jgi:hypothetical protein
VVRSAGLERARRAVHVVEAKFGGQSIGLRRSRRVHNALHGVSQRPHRHRLQPIPDKRKMSMNVVVEIERRRGLVGIQHDDRNHVPPNPRRSSSANRRRNPEAAAPAILSDKNVLRIVDQTAGPDYSRKLQTAAPKNRAAGGMRKRSMHRMSQFKDRTPVRANRPAAASPRRDRRTRQLID